MAFEQRARREQAKLRLAIDGLAGTGKTYTSILIACILAELMRPRLGRRGKVGVVDTEHESASLFAMTDAQLDEYEHLSGDAAIAYLCKTEAFDFFPMPLDNHSPRQYVELIKNAEASGVDVLVIDSLSHAWMGKNGALEQKDIAAIAGKENQYTAWRHVTPMHNQLVDTMLGSNLHIIATMRRKMEYVQTERDGRKVIDKVGLAAIQREGMEYEFTMVGDMDHQHNMTIAKHRTTGGVLQLGEVIEHPGEAFTRRIWKWLTAGANPRARQVDVTPVADSVAINSDDIIETALVAMENAEDFKSHLPGLKKLGEQFPGNDKKIRERYTARKNRQGVVSPLASGTSSSEPATQPTNSDPSSTVASTKRVWTPYPPDYRGDGDLGACSVCGAGRSDHGMSDECNPVVAP